MQLEEAIEEANDELQLIPLVAEAKPWESGGRKTVVEFQVSL